MRSSREFNDFRDFLVEKRVFCAGDPKIISKVLIFTCECWHGRLKSAPKRRRVEKRWKPGFRWIFAAPGADIFPSRATNERDFVELSGREESRWQLAEEEMRIIQLPQSRVAAVGELKQTLSFLWRTRIPFRHPGFPFRPLSFVAIRAFFIFYPNREQHLLQIKNERISEETPPPPRNT